MFGQIKVGNICTKEKKILRNQMTVGKLRVASGDHSHSLGKCPAAPIVLGPRIVSIGLHMLTRAIAFMVVSTQHLLSTWQIAALYAFLAMFMERYQETCL